MLFLLRVRAGLAMLTIGALLAACSPGDQDLATDRRAAAAESSVASDPNPTTGTPASSPSESASPSESGAPSESASSASSLPTVPACATAVTIGPLTIRAGSANECLERRGLTWSSTASVTVGGIRFSALSPQSRIVFDPFNARVRASGYEAIGSLLGADLVLASGEIDWSFQYRPDQNTGLGRFMPAQSDVIDLALVSQLPGLEDVRSLPTDPSSGFTDFAAVSEESVARVAERFPTLAGPEVVIPLSAIGLSAVPRLTISLPTAVIQKLTGLEVGGAVSMQPVERDGSLGMVIGGAVRLPALLERAEGEFSVFVPLDGPTKVDLLRIDVPRIEFGGGRIEDLLLDYDAPTKTWSGRALVLVGPGGNAVGVGGTLSIVDGRLQTIGVTVAGLPVDIGGVMSLNRLGGTLRFDPFSLEATGQFGVGPFVPGVGNLAVIDGGLQIGETEIAATGVMKVGTLQILGQSLPGLQVADAAVRYRWDGVAAITGNASLSFDVGDTWSIRGGVRGAANASALSLAGEVRVSLGALIELGGTAAVGTRGVVACGLIGSTWFTPETRIGISHDWGSGRVDLRGSECNTNAYEVPVAPADQVTAAGNRNGRAEPPTVAFVRSAAPVEPAVDGVSLDIPGGQQMLTISLDGDDDTASITGPDGTRIDLSDDASTDDPANPRWIVLQPPGSEVRSVVIGTPAGGTWLVESVSAETDSVRAEVVAAESRAVELAADPLEAAPVSTNPGPVTVDTTDSGDTGGTDGPTSTDEPQRSTTTAGASSTTGPATTAGDGSDGQDGASWWLLGALALVAAAGALALRALRVRRR